MFWCLLHHLQGELFAQELRALCHFANLQNWLHNVSSNSVHGWCKTFINTLTLTCHRLAGYVVIFVVYVLFLAAETTCREIQGRDFESYE